MSAVPRLEAALAPQLAADLAPFTVAAIEDALGPLAAAALHREQPLPARRALAGRADPVSLLTRLFVLGDDVPLTDLDAALPRTTHEGAVRAGLVSVSGSGPDALPVPWSTCARTPRTTHSGGWPATSAKRPPVVPCARTTCSVSVAPRSPWPSGRCARPVRTALDLGTGCGVQAFHAARHASSVVATDVSPRALAFAEFNSRLNAGATGPFAGRELELRHGEPARTRLGPADRHAYDLVVSNPPFVITPRAAGLPHYEYRDGGLAGDEVVRRLVSGVADLLAAGGVAQLLGNWEHVEGVDWRERVAAWLPPDVQAWVVQREVQDPAEYAQTWARDGGHLPDTPGHDALVTGWLDDFAGRGVEAIGFGVVTLRRAEPAWQRLEELRGPVQGPMGDVVRDVLDAETWLRSTSDEELLAARLVVAADVTEERHGLPGAPDPQVILLRQGGGLRRVVRADTALAALVGACDGELTVGQVVGALAHLLDEPETELRARLLPDVRHLVADLLLHRPSGGVSPRVPLQDHLRPRCGHRLHTLGVAALPSCPVGGASTGRFASKGRSVATSSSARRRLVIVESPAKAKTIAGYLGEGYDVEASVGHIRDLPQPSELPADMKKGPFGKFAVDLENGFEPYYVVDTDKRKKVAELKRLLKDADELYLATDEDREGEAIAWHLLEALQPKVPVKRMVFHEITREALQRALESTRDIDDRLVDAQETRRILDRLYGYEVSPVLWRKIRQGLSAGRVQSVATRMVVERERERMAFRSASYWDLLGTFAADDEHRLHRAADRGGRRPGGHRQGLRRPRPAADDADRRPPRRGGRDGAGARPARRPRHRAQRRGEAVHPPSGRTVHHLDPAAGGEPQAAVLVPARDAGRAVVVRERLHHLHAYRLDRAVQRGAVRRAQPGGRAVRPAVRAGQAAVLREQVEERAGGARGDPPRGRPLPHSRRRSPGSCAATTSGCTS